MAGTKLEDSICQAIEMYCKKAISNAPFDKTIQASIVECVDEENGKYRVKYQDSKFYAYSAIREVQYQKDDIVSILIPGNDSNKEKFILGLVGGTKSSQLEEVIELVPTYEEVGQNFIDEQFFDILDDNLVKEIKMSSYVPNDTVLLYSSNSGDGIHRVTLIDPELIALYLHSSDYLKIEARVKIQIPDSHNIIEDTVDYGVRVKLTYTNLSGEDETFEYLLNKNQMTGRIRNSDLIQTGYFQIPDIDNYTFKEIAKIELYEHGFVDEALNPNDPLPPDYENIIFSDLVVQGVRATEGIITNGSGIILHFPRGYCFSKNRADNDYLTVKPSLYVNNQLISNTDKISYYYAIKDIQIGLNSENYCEHTGQNWRCLNSKNEEGIWESASSIFSIYTNMTPAYENFFKVVVIYEGFKLTREFQIYDLARNKIVIESDTHTYLKNKSKLFTCRIINPTGDEVSPVSIPEDVNESPVQLFKYVWGYHSGAIINSIKPDSTFAHLDVNTCTFDNIYTQLRNAGTVECSVYSLDESIFYGTAFYNVELVELNKSYNIILYNNEKIFYYGNNGQIYDFYASPDPISFKIFDEKGEELSSEDYAKWDFTWKIPGSDTMLEVLGVTSESERDDMGYVTITDREITYKPKIIYSQNLDNNTIKLELFNNEYQSKYQYSTNFFFIKEGDPGTNGTDYICKIVPNLPDSAGDFQDLPCFIYKQSEPNVGHFNFNPEVNYSFDSEAPNNFEDNAIPPFKVIIVKQGTQRYDSLTAQEDTSEGNDQHIGYFYDEEENTVRYNVKVEWSILRTNYATYQKEKYFDFTNFNFDTYTGRMHYSPLIRKTPEGQAPYYEDINGIKIHNQQHMNFSNILHAVVTIQRQNSTVSNSGVFTNSSQVPVAILHDFVPLITLEYTGDSEELFATGGFKLDRNSGFTKVVYASDGSSPSYNNELFKIVYDESITIGANGESWKILGSRYDYNNNIHNFINSFYLKDATPNPHPAKSRKIVPYGTYDGVVVNNAIYYQGPLGNLHIPIVFYINRYGLTNLNVWTGNGIELNEEGGYILANQLCAGHKEDDNSFTGVVAGDVQEGGKTYRETGLFGYSSSRRTFFLDSTSGRVQIGQGLVFDPTTNPVLDMTGNIVYDTSALIYSNSFWNQRNIDEKGHVIDYKYRTADNALNPATVNTGITGKEKGMLINIQEGEIFFNSGNFYLTSDGSLYSRSGKIGGWTIEEGQLLVERNGEEFIRLSGDGIFTKYIVATGGMIGAAEITAKSLIVASNKEIILYAYSAIEYTQSNHIVGYHEEPANPVLPGLGGAYIPGQSESGSGEGSSGESGSGEGSGDVEMVTVPDYAMLQDAVVINDLNFDKYGNKIHNNFGVVMLVDYMYYYYDTNLHKTYFDTLMILVKEKRTNSNNETTSNYVGGALLSGSLDFGPYTDYNSSRNLHSNYVTMSEFDFSELVDPEDPELSYNDMEYDTIFSYLANKYGIFDGYESYRNMPVSVDTFEGRKYYCDNIYTKNGGTKMPVLKFSKNANVRYDFIFWWTRHDRGRISVQLETFIDKTMNSNSEPILVNALIDKDGFSGVFSGDFFGTISSNKGVINGIRYDSNKDIFTTSRGLTFNFNDWVTKSYVDSQDSAERQRAQSAENILSNAISSEESRAIAAESNLRTTISDEETRAKGKENDLSSSISGVSSRVSTIEGKFYTIRTQTSVPGSIGEKEIVLVYKN